MTSNFTRSLKEGNMVPAAARREADGEKKKEPATLTASSADVEQHSRRPRGGGVAKTSLSITALDDESLCMTRRSERRTAERPTCTWLNMGSYRPQTISMKRIIVTRL